jgi:hypothetical protein
MRLILVSSFYAYFAKAKMDLKQIHEIRRVRGMIARITDVVGRHLPGVTSANTLADAASVSKELREKENELTFTVIANATPREILSNASRLASLARIR